MGKRIIQQRRGRGSHTYRANSHRSKADPTYVWDEGEVVTGEVADLIHDSGRTAPLAVIRFGPEHNQETAYMVAPEGLSVGDTVEYNGEVLVGNVLPLYRIPEGTPICNIELQPGDGGKLVRSSGTFAFIVSHTDGKTNIRLPSKKFKLLNSNCKATVGRVAGRGRTEKPFTKAGAKHHLARSRGKLYPRTSAKAMNAVDHPFGGKNMGKHKSRSRHAPPGAKVGSIAAKRSGKKKK